MRMIVSLRSGSASSTMETIAEPSVWPAGITMLGPLGKAIVGRRVAVPERAKGNDNVLARDLAQSGHRHGYVRVLVSRLTRRS